MTSIDTSGNYGEGRSEELNGWHNQSTLWLDLTRLRQAGKHAPWQRLGSCSLASGVLGGEGGVEGLARRLRWHRGLFAGGHDINRIFLLVLPTMLLLDGLYISTRLSNSHATAWIIIPFGLAIVMTRARYTETERPAVRLLQLIGLLSAFYDLIHY